MFLLLIFHIVLLLVLNTNVNCLHVSSAYNFLQLKCVSLGMVRILKPLCYVAVMCNQDYNRILARQLLL